MSFHKFRTDEYNEPVKNDEEAIKTVMARTRKLGCDCEPEFMMVHGLNEVGEMTLDVSVIHSPGCWMTLPQA